MQKINTKTLEFLSFCFLAVIFFGCSSEAKKENSLGKASDYFDSRQYSKAEIEYLNVLQIDPENLQAISHLGILYFDQGRVQRALPFLQRASNLDSENTEVRLRIGATYLALGKWKEGWEAANLVLEHSPDNERAPVFLAEASMSEEYIVKSRQRLKEFVSSESGKERASVHVALGLLDLKQQKMVEAEYSFKRARSLDSESAIVNAALGNFYWAKNDLNQAEKAFQTAAKEASAYSPDRLRYAQFKIQTGDILAGKSILKEIVEETPDYITALSILAEVEASQENFEESAVLITKGLRLEPVDPEMLLMRGRLTLAQGNAEKAVEEFEAMLKFYPKATQGYQDLTRAYLAQGETAEALKSLDEALLLAPDNPELLLLKARLKAGMGDFSVSIVLLKKLTRKWPQVKESQQLLAEVYRAAGDAEEALGIYQLLAEQNPEDAQGRFMVGLMLLEQEKNEEARYAFELSVTLDPNFSPALVQLTNLDLLEERYDQALERLTRELKQHPEITVWYLLQGEVLLAQDKKSQAETAFRKVLEIQPGNREAHMQLAQLYLKMGKENAALAELQEVVKKTPKDVGAHMLIGQMHGQQKRYDKARAAYEEILVINPRFGPAMNDLAYLYSEEFDQLEKAYAMAQEARKMFPEDPSLGDTFGWILFKRGEYAEALNILQESADALPDNNEVLFHLAMTHYSMGHEVLARSKFEEALRGDSDFIGKEECKKYLSVLLIDSAVADLDVIEDLEARELDLVVLGRLGELYQARGDVGRARDFYEEALSINPKYSRVMAKLASLLVENGDMGKGYELAQEAYNLSPNNPDISYVMGKVAYLSGDYAWAIKLFKETALSQPDFPEVQYQLAMSLYALGRSIEAKVAMSRALGTPGVFSRTEEAKRFLKMIELSEDIKRAFSEEAEIEKILSTEPEYVPALMVLAGINQERSDVSIARNIYEVVLEQFPDFDPAKRHLAILYSADPAENEKAYEMASDAYETYSLDMELVKALGIIVFRRGDYTRAVRRLRECLRKDEEDPVLWYYLGMSHFHLKDWVEARQSLERSLELGLSDEWVDQVNEILADLELKENSVSTPTE
ncbi:MAG: tetratricopeptide repeat protein [Opitutaceae bacterium]|nr:tetratricopeptide repeat protein [Opitutaceae bacterium]